jgi:hypothetical protein
MDIIKAFKNHRKGSDMKKMIFAVAAALSMAQLHAGHDGYFQLSVFSPGELPSASSTIKGARLSLLCGQCEEFYGLDVSMVGFVSGSMYGAQPGVLWNDVGTDAYGLQVSCMNYVKGDFFGCGIALGNVTRSDACGFQCGVYNHVSGDMFGCQLGLGNVAVGNAYGFQGGIYNHASGCMRGFQLGVMNWSGDLAGCQIGLANIVTSRSVVALPILNVGW